MGLLLACFGPVLFAGEQFSYRDAGEYDYPLYQRVQREWAAGRWPLWEPEENGGMPLVGNPTAPVLYPGKSIYALPYAWAARLYVIAHVLLPGIVILADTFYPGWTLTIDGRPAPILRANRTMRGAAVEAGTHQLVYTSRPLSCYRGSLISLGSIAGGVAVGLGASRKAAPQEVR